MEHSTVSKHTSAWKFQVWISFLISLTMTIAGIVYLSVDPWVKGYLLMGFIFTIGSCFGLAKTIRDDFEANQIIHRITQAKTEKILKEYE